MPDVVCADAVRMEKRLAILVRLTRLVTQFSQSVWISNTTESQPMPRPERRREWDYSIAC